MIRMDNVSFTYAGVDRPSVTGIDLEIPSGQTVLLCGRSGCGKTTVTRLVNGLAPHFHDGELSGSVSVAGIDVAATPLYGLAGTVGSVFQNPRSQFFNVDTTSELAFGPENLGRSRTDIEAAVGSVADELDLHRLLGRSIFQLSGGEKQRIACGSVAALRPPVIVLDEPTSNLDFAGIALLRRCLEHWKAAGRTVVVAEHRLHFLTGLADRAIVLENGRIADDIAGDDFFSRPPAWFRARGLRQPSLAKLDWHDSSATVPVQESLGLSGLRYRYRGSKQLALDVDGRGLPGGVICVIGENGAGKTTLARTLCGLDRRGHGTVEFRGRQLTRRRRLRETALVMQDVDRQLFTESVLDEVVLSMTDGSSKYLDGAAAGDVEGRALGLLATLDLADCRDRHPLSLSGGQKQRLAIASALAAGRQLVVFDEPTSGLDYDHMKTMAAEIRRLHDDHGVTSVVVTHDPEFIAACGTYVLHVDGGRIVDDYPMDDDGRRRLTAHFAAAS
ncbi:ABC transporter ATP-binding protein [Bifidobacterium choloepi]|uniref:ABC transporter ATP-binding protein n=1 Tax=Bifidobacterium choloepi TaxID=2614131 RepID=A0A6I5MZB5_9BIFI|nr:ABC transporter ATP-binding protein [Bifidobacterium choloepi]NEG69556.1 ABC transporter ATP-binding protein [Bifidobacterium choloepi]